MRTAFRFAALAAALLPACATTTLDTKRPIELSKGWTSTFRQDGKRITDLADRLKEHPASATRMDGYDAKVWSAFALQAIGAGLILWNTTDNLAKAVDRSADPLRKDTSSYGLTFLGAGIFLASLPFGIMANRQVGEAVEAYNGSLAPGGGTAGSHISIPIHILAAVEGSAGRRQCVAGLAFRF